MTDSQLQVCHLLGSLGSGGRESLLIDIIEHAPSWVDHSLCCFTAHADTVDRFESIGAPVTSFDVGGPSDVGPLFTVYLHFLRREIDILHLHGPRAQIPGRLMGRLSGISSIISTHHGVRDMFPATLSRVERVTRPLDSVTVAVSEGVRRSYVGNRPRPQWRTIQNGVDVDGFRSAVQSAHTDQVRERHGLTDELVFLNVGRYVPPKAQLDLIHAMSVALDDLPSSHLFIVGGRGAMEGRLRTAVRERGLDSHVSVTGRVDDIVPYYGLADVFVSSSLQEGLPIVLLEAMAAKLPVIATAIPGVSELITDGESGILTAPGQPTELSDRLLEMCDPAIRNRLGASGYRRVRSHFDISRTVEEYHAVYREIAG